MSTPPTQQEPSIRLAAQKPGPSPGAAAELRWPAPEAPRPRILYADHDDTLRRLGERLLLQSGYAVDTVADGAEAWAALLQTQYDLVVTDNDMPHLTGVELICKSRQARLSVPVILTSGTLDTLPPNDRSRPDCAAVLAKPFTCEQLLLAIREALQPAAPRPPARRPSASRSPSHRPRASSAGASTDELKGVATMPRMIPLYSTSSQAEIEHRARALFEQAGQPAGRDLDHWLRAEADFLAQLGLNPAWPNQTGATTPQAAPV